MFSLTTFTFSPKLLGIKSYGPTAVKESNDGTRLNHIKKKSVLKYVDSTEVITHTDRLISLLEKN